MYVYCTNSPLTEVGSSVTSDIALDGNNPSHIPIIATYSISVEGDLGGVPNRVLIMKTETGYEAVQKEDYDYLQLRSYALAINKTYIEVKRGEGCPVSFGYLVSCQLQDIQNMTALVDVMVAAGIPEVDFRDHVNAMHLVTVPMMKQILLEVYQYGIVQYQVKWGRETQIKATTTYEELMALLVSWGIAPDM